MKKGPVKILILGGTRFVGLELLKRLDKKKHVEVHVASRTDPGNYSHYYCIDRKDQLDLNRLIENNTFDIIVDFLSFSMPDAEKIISAIRRRGGYNPFLITISSTYVYGNPRELEHDKLYDEGCFDPLTFTYSKLDRPEIDYFLGKRSMESYIANHYDNYSLVRLPIILGKSDYTGRTTYFLDLIERREKIFLGNDFGVSNFVFSNEVGLMLEYIMEERVAGPLNCCFNETLNQLDILSSYCEFANRPLEDVLDDTLSVVKSPFYYRRDFVIDNSKQAGLLRFDVSFKDALFRELRKIQEPTIN